MKEINQEARDRYFSELQLQLRRAGFEVGEVKEGNVDVLWEGTLLCQASDSGNSGTRHPVPVRKSKYVFVLSFSVFSK